MTTAPPRRHFWAGTIWDRDLLEEVPPRFRHLYTVWLPLEYFILLCFGGAGAVFIVPSLASLATAEFADYWTLTVGLLATLSLAGLVARRALLELVSVITLAVCLSSYLIALVVLAFALDADRLPNAIGLLTILVLPVWRAFDIVRTERRRNA